MSDSDPSPLDARLDAAVAAMETEDWTAGVGLLVGLLGELDGLGLPAVEATTRMLLAQAFASQNQLETAVAQAGLAMVVAEESEDREVIHRCMALTESLRIMGR